MMKFKYLPDKTWEIENLKEYKDIIEIIEREKKEILPKEEDNSGIFYALNITPLNKTKVLIIGQDPYPNPERAQGIVFYY